MQVHGNSTANSSLNALLAQSRQNKAQFALASSSVEAKPGLGLGRGLGELKKAGEMNPPTPASAQQPDPTDETMEGIRKHWGQGESPYDLNGDGTVNIDDILHYVAGQSVSNPDTPAETDPAATISAAQEVPAAADMTIPDELSTTRPALTMDGFNQYWGQSIAQYDLNSDGTVNMDDLLAFLSAQQTQEAPEVSPPVFDRHAQELTNADSAGGAAEALDAAAADETPAVAGNQDAAGQPQVTLDGMLAAWGTSNSTFDLNADGTVNMDDVLAHIAQLGAPAQGGAESQRAAGEVPSQLAQTDSAGKTKHAESAHARMRNLVDSLITRLNETGFEQAPPTNIRDLVDRLNLAPSQMNFVMNRLGERYPLGLGVNLKA